jgi:four helix bundle protein
MAVSETVRCIRGRGTAGLKTQIVNSASSIPNNIVEGRAMKGDREFARFLGYSIASSSELEYHLIEARDLHLIGTSEFKSLLTRLVEVRKMLYGLQRTVRRDQDS